MSAFASNVNIPAPPDNVPEPRGRGPWHAALVSVAAIVTAVSGCSSTEAGPRQAAELLGPRICIENNFADGVNVTYTKLDSDASRKDPFYYEGDLPKDTESCAEGTLFSSSPDFVAGKLVIPGQALEFGFSGFNPLIGSPYAVLTQFSGPYPNYCTDVSGFDKGETRLWDNGVVRITITRQNDDQYKEFFIRLEPSQGQRVGNDPCDG
jgi:hypothetical protein